MSEYRLAGKPLSACKQALLGILLAALAGSAVAEDVHGAVHSETLLQASQSWDGQGYQSYPAGQPELSVLKITIPPNTALAWHRHPVPNAAYVVSGTLTVEKQQSGERRVLQPGQVLPEMVESVHRGFSGDQEVVLIVFYAGAKGVPLSQKAQ